ncbi:MAG: phage holin family protein [Pseudomonadota bacterium]
MRDEERPERSAGDDLPDQSHEPTGLEPVGAEPAHASDNANEEELFDESLTEEIAALIDDGRTYAEAELAFRKTQASLAGRKIGGMVGFGILALIVLHLALIGLVVGLVIALEPLVTIWGAIGIVVGVLLLGVIALVLKVRRNALGLAALFEDDGG